MATSLFGKKVEKTSLREAYPPRSGGISLLETKRMAELAGFRTEAFQCEWSDLEELEGPAILYFTNHLVLLAKTESGSAIVADPAVGPIPYERDQAPDAWSGICLELLSPEKGFQPSLPERKLPRFAAYRRYLKNLGLPLILTTVPVILLLTEGELLKRLSLSLFGSPTSGGITGRLLLLLIAVELAREVLSLGTSWSWIRATRHFDLTIARDFFAKILEFDWSRFRSLRYGDLSIIFDETRALRKFMLGAGLKLVETLLTVVALSWALVSIAPVWILLPFLIAALQLRIMLPLRHLILTQSQIETQTREKWSTLFRGLFQSRDLLTRLSVERHSILSLMKLFGRNIEARTAQAKTEARISLATASIQILFEALLLFGIYRQVSAGGLDAGSAVAAYWFTSGLLGSLESVGTLYINSSRLKLTFSRLGVVFAAETGSPEDPASTAFTGPVKSISIQNLGFSYLRDPEFAIIRDFDLDLDRPGIYGLVGPSGSGKSTLGLMLTGLLNPDSGEIRINGTPVGAATLRSLSCHTFQDEQLLAGSLAENITLSSMIDRPDDYRDCLKDAMIEDPDDWERRLDRLSEGQKQRVVLARALYRNRPIVVLDEGTHSLDSERESLFLSRLREHHPEKFIFIITHRPELLKHLDQVFPLGHS
jgi:ABC-type bacteriocin/lantibiotic exporter with double-glycine peptidase domain